MIFKFSLGLSLDQGFCEEKGKKKKKKKVRTSNIPKLLYPLNFFPTKSLIQIQPKKFH